MATGRLAVGRGDGRWVAWCALVAALLVPAASKAQVGLRVERAPDRVRVDGMLREWRGTRFGRVGSGSDASMRYALAHDDRGLYVAARVSDERVVRAVRPGRKEDAVVVTLVLPAGRGAKGLELWLYPGKPGVRAVAGLAPLGGRPRPVRGAKVVESPRDGGYDLEAFVPWSAIPGAGARERGRGAIRLRDVDSEARRRVEAEPSSAEVDRRALERLPELVVAGSSAELLHAFLAHKNLVGVRPRADLGGDVAGDGREERVVVVDRYAVVLGPGFREGKGYDFLELPVRKAADVRDAGLRDVTGNGKAELLLRLRQRNELGARDVWMVFAITEESVRPLWGVELRKEVDDGWAEAELDVLPQRRGPPILRVRAGEARGLSPSDLTEASARDVAPMLLPWGKVLERRYRFQGGRFRVVGEKENPDYEPPAERRRTTARRRTRSRPAPARGPTADEMLAAAKSRLGIAEATQPDFEETVDLAEDERPERLAVYGKALVIVGPGFRGGDGFFHYEIPVADASDVLRVRALDLTGDGRREVLMRLRQRFDEGLAREVLLAYCLHENSFNRILAVEVARMQKGREVRNHVKPVREGRRFDLVISPGRARGWDASSWPFRDGGADDGVAPLLLPWRDEALRYRYRPADG
ncbi:MAG: hypothetical protein ACODAU_04535 [Myxococcota bacterium]